MSVAKLLWTSVSHKNDGISWPHSDVKAMLNTVPESDVRAQPRVSQRRSNEPAAPVRNAPTGAAAPAANRFAGLDRFAALENETTQTFQASDELLELARAKALSNGATRTFKAPAALLELARRKKGAERVATTELVATSAPPEAAAALSTGDTSEAPESGPRLTFCELTEDECAWVQAALNGATTQADEPSPGQESSAPALQTSSAEQAPPERAAPKKSKLRWLFISLCLVALSAVAVELLSRHVHSGVLSPNGVTRVNQLR
jgi:hypothetical protein